LGDANMTDSEAASSNDHHVNFDAPAVHRKWPSLDNERREGTVPYLLLEGMSASGSCWQGRHAIGTYTRFILHLNRRSLLQFLAGETVTELVRLREFF